MTTKNNIKNIGIYFYDSQDDKELLNQIIEYINDEMKANNLSKISPNDYYLRILKLGIVECLKEILKNKSKFT